MDRAHEYALRLFLAWLNERFRRSFAPAGGDGEVWRAADGDDRLAAVVADLSETDESWDRRREALAARLDEARPGSYLLWVPSGGRLPAGEPEESEWARRVVLAASRLASGRAAEVRLPVRLLLAKVGNEGGYANVTGGLSRHWTTITDRLRGSYFLDSSALRRFTRNEEERQQLYEHIALLSQGLEQGGSIEFEHEDAWTVQRLRRGAAATILADGWAIAGCPPGFDPADGTAVRRLLRGRLAAARSLLAVGDSARVLLLVGAYDYIEDENAGPALRGFDPALAAAFDAVALVADGEVKPLLMSRRLQLAPEHDDG